MKKCISHMALLYQFPLLHNKFPPVEDLHHLIQFLRIKDGGAT